MEDLKLEAVSVLNVSAGDTIVLKIKAARISQEVRQGMAAQIQAMLPVGVKVIVLDELTDISVIKLTDAAAA